MKPRDRAPATSSAACVSSITKADQCALVVKDVDVERGRTPAPEQDLSDAGASKGCPVPLTRHSVRPMWVRRNPHHTGVVSHDVGSRSSTAYCRPASGRAD